MHRYTPQTLRTPGVENGKGVEGFLNLLGAKNRSFPTPTLDNSQLQLCPVSPFGPAVPPFPDSSTEIHPKIHGFNGGIHHLATL